MKVIVNTPAVLSLGQCNTEKFVLIVVPGLSASSSSSLPISTPMTSSMEMDHSDHPPAIVSSESVDRRQVRRDPYSSETKTQNQRMRIKSKYGETRIIPTYRSGCKISERILRMTEFLNAETHTRVLLMKYL